MTRSYDQNSSTDEGRYGTVGDSYIFRCLIARVFITLKLKMRSLVDEIQPLRIE